LRIVDDHGASGLKDAAVSAPRCVGYNRAMNESPGPPPAATVNDPVCGKAVDPAITMWHLQHEGQRIYFCSLSCALRFKDAPDSFVTRSHSNP
jgi:YHS domain-containing protein